MGSLGGRWAPADPGLMFPFEEAEEAYRYYAEGDAFGKVVIARR